MNIPTGHNFFKKDNGRKLPVDEKYLVPFLTPTAPGTNFWDPPPPGVKPLRHRGRCILQVHQILHLFRAFNVELSGKALLDIGTGNGMVPRLLLALSAIELAVGADPYLEGEHTAQWPPHDKDEFYSDLYSYIQKKMPSTLDYAVYADMVEHEIFSQIPTPVEWCEQPEKVFLFSKTGAHDLDNIDVGRKFDILYCKAIEHVHDWPGILRSAAAVSNSGATLYIKHVPFFGYLGPHRFSTPCIPWGHLLLTDDEYCRYASEFHSDRAEKMIESYFQDLTFPRQSVSDLLREAGKSGWSPAGVVIDNHPRISQMMKNSEDVEDFWGNVYQNYPHLGIEEVYASMYHIFLRRD